MRAYGCRPGYVFVAPLLASRHSATCWMPFYLHANGILAPEIAGETHAHISLEPERGSRLFGSDVDFYTKPGRGEAVGLSSEITSGSDPLIFETLPLLQDIQIAGIVEAVLWVSSCALGHDFNFTLTDVCPPNPDYPDGYTIVLLDDFFRPRYPAPAGFSAGNASDISRVRLESLPLNDTLRRGHRIRISISMSDYSRGRRLMLPPKDRISIQRSIEGNQIYLDKQRPSHIVFPINLY